MYCWVFGGVGSGLKLGVMIFKFELGLGKSDLVFKWGLLSIFFLYVFGFIYYVSFSIII